MASPGADDQRTYILSINFLDGKGFGPELQAVTCAATFAGETKLTPYSVGRESHVWNTTLQWRVTMDQFRRLSALGQKDCKVVLSAKDGTKLGWFLIDMRAAKLQAQYKKDEGVWNTLSGAKKGETPQVCVLALFYEDRPDAWSPGPKQASPGRQRAAPGGRRPAAAGRAGGGADGADETSGAATGDGIGELPGPGDGAAFPSARAAAATVAGGDAGGDGAAGGFVASGEPPGANPTAGLPNFGSPPRRSPADDGPFRHFALTVDVRSFQSTKRLPLSSAAVYVQAVLPAELIELVVASGFKLPSRLAPLTSHPAVDIPRGAEGAVPNAYGTLEFSAGVVELARVLAREPRISVEAWHKERFRTDMLLGAGSVPLTPLLQGAWVDGYAPLFAMVASSVGGELREERVQMGMLRVVLSLEDKGPAPVPGTEAAAAAIAAAAAGGGAGRTAAVVTATVAPTPVPGAAKHEPYAVDGDAGDAASSGPDGLGVALTGAADGSAGGDGGLQVREIYPAPTTATSAAAAADAAAAGLPAAHAMAPPPALLLPPPPAMALGGAPSRLPPGMGLQGSPEFEAAWELEVWKKAEEARWRSELREREAQRMLVLESEWRRRERAREAEIGALKAEYLALEERAQQVLSSAEARERRILAAEEALLRRRKELEREAGSRLAEAEAAVRRLQVECEHQLDIERDRNAELVRRVAMLEERLAASDARCLAVENEFADFRAASRSTPEAELARQLAAAREAAKAAEVRAAKAAKAKQGYKDQVRKLAEQLALLQRRRQRDEDVAFGRPVAGGGLGVGGGGGHLLSASLAGPPMSLRAAAEEQIRAASSQQQELAAMRLQLQAIKAAALAQLSPSSSPRAGQEASAAGAQSSAAAATAGGAAGGDEAPDLRSSDQQRDGRHAAEWRPAASGAGQAAVAPGAASRGALAASEAARSLFPPETTSASSASRPAGSGPGAPAPPLSQRSAATNITSSSNPTTSSSVSAPSAGMAAVTAGQLRHAHEDLYAAAAAAQQRLFPSAQGPAGSTGSAPAGSAGSGRGADRWAAPRVAASAPAAGPGTGSGASPPSVSATPQSATPQVAAGADAVAPPSAAASVSASAPSTATASQRQQAAFTSQPGHQRGSQPDGDSRPSTASNPPGHDGSSAGGDGGRTAGLGVGGAASAGGPSDVEKRSLADHLASANQWRQQQQQQQYSGEGEGYSPAGSGAAAASAPSWLEHGREFLSAQQQPAYSQQSYSPYSVGGDLGGGGGSSGSGGGDGGGYMYGSGSSFPDLVGPTADLAEIQRLTRRKMELLQSGAYGLHDTVIRLLDDRIQALMAESAGLPA